MSGKHDEAKQMTMQLQSILSQGDAKYKRSVDTLAQSYDSYMK